VIESIEQPMAEAVVDWLSAGDGGRLSGPPTAPVYMATSVFVHGDDASVQPGWPISADKLSIMLQKIEDVTTWRSRCLVGFLVPDLARAHMRVGTQILVLEGPKVVARARVDKMLAA
jgi:hypothetical protein